MKSLREKETVIINDLRNKLDSASLSILTDFRGLNVKEISELRNRLRDNGVEYKVIKNTLVKLAVKDINLSSLNEYLIGPTAIAIDANDTVSLAKTLIEFNKKYKKLEIKAGILQGHIIEANKVKDLASLPSKEVLLAKLAMTLNSPMRGLLICLEAIKEQKES
ncbi:MAG: 50S ribosomal protein L10 [bacterium]|nr:50S ribosomal protein L10 [bacterium]